MEDGMSKIGRLRRYAIGAVVIVLSFVTTMSAADLGVLYEYFHSLQPQAGLREKPTSVKGNLQPEVRRQATR
jgi:hypothetical protein